MSKYSARKFSKPLCCSIAASQGKELKDVFSCWLSQLAGNILAASYRSSNPGLQSDLVLHLPHLSTCDTMTQMLALQHLYQLMTEGNFSSKGKKCDSITARIFKLQKWILLATNTMWLSASCICLFLCACRHIQEADNHRYHHTLHIHPPHWTQIGGL